MHVFGDLIHYSAFSFRHSSSNFSHFNSVVELTGDVTPDIWQLMHADLIVTTPEKWDGISRSWQQRVYVRHVALIIIDEIHLLGEERGPVLEVIPL